MNYKILTIIFFLLIIYNNSNAQLLKSYGFKLGMVQSGETWDYSWGSPNIYDISLWSYDVGGYVEWFNLPIISVLTEMHYLQKGAKEEIPVTTMEQPDGTGEFVTFTPRMDYISIELLAKLRFETSLVTFYGLAGPRMDVLIGHNEYASGAVFDDFKSPEFGINLGGGFDLPIFSEYRLGVNIIYNYSPQEVFSNNNLTVNTHSTEFLLYIGL